MIVLLRGHIRDSFSDNRLYDFINNVIKRSKNIEIYIHTWNIIQSNISWRSIPKKNIKVTEDMIKKYFKNNSSFIKKIIIDDDNTIELNGNTNGYIAGSDCPIIGWKNYWYGQHKIIDFINSNKELDKEKKSFILNMRLDVFNNPHGFDENNIISFIKQYYNEPLTENKFMYEKFFLGCDNCFIGNVETMYKLTQYFHFNLDDILKKYKIIGHQEGLVMIENSVMFNSLNKIYIKNVNNYKRNHEKLKNFYFINHTLQKIN